MGRGLHEEPRMSREKWSRLSKETVLSTPYYRLSRDRYVLPDGAVGEYHYIDIPGSAMVVPLLESGELVLVRQYRYLMARASLEFPAGGMKGGQPLQTAREELREEAGYHAGRLEKIGEFAPYNGASNELCHVFVGTGLTTVAAEPDATEELEVLSLPIGTVQERIASGEIWDGMTIASFFLFEQWRGDGLSRGPCG
jgi:ADP-ribose pyrophosphatase